MLCRVNEAPEDGVFIHGLFIEGAQWSIDEKSVIEQVPKVIVNDFPCIHFIVSENYFCKKKVFQLREKLNFFHSQSFKLN